MDEPHPRRKPWAARILVVLFFAVVVPISSSILYTYSPTQHSYIPCPFHWLTGLHCPGCGATRCTYALLHGDIRQALAYNSLFVIMLPLIGYVTVRMVIELWTDKTAPGIDFPIWLQRGLIVVVVVYWIARNIDVVPLSLLAPHEI
ncbi:MAG: DUF2752 domain-containing protein [Gemmataceae bacterium]|nr:DUF2752 domain-containing protein [Gemmataceae bacterium]